MAQEMAQFTIPPEAERALMQAALAGWDEAKKLLAPHIWTWFNAHKDEKIGALGHVFPIYWGSFDLVKGALTSIFGPDTTQPVPS